MLGVDEHRVRVVAPDVGGGFGQKCVVAREEVLVCVAARAVGAPVKWVEDRVESLLAGFQGHEQRFAVRAGFDAEGRMLAVDADIVADVGAYSTHPFTCGVEPLMAATEMLGPYRVAHYRCRTRAVATNKAPMAPYRGVARPQMVLAMERLLQKAALKLDLEVDEIRLRNLAREFPHVSATGLGSTRAPTTSRSSCARARSTCRRSGSASARRAKRAGCSGSASPCFAERTGYGTEAFAQRKMAITPGYDTALVRMDPSGSVLLSVGTSGHGQGHQTTLSQVAADRLGLTPDRVEVRQGDTDATPYGWGTFASRSMVVGGGATRRASDLLAVRLKRLAAHLLEADPEDLELRDGEAVVRGAPGKSVAFARDRAPRLPRDPQAPGRLEPGLECTASFDPPGTFSNACHGAIVELDPETAGVRIERYLVVEDCGVMVNPAIVEGQVRGGVAQGIAAALYEELAYGEDGQLQNASLMDYLVPTAWEIPAVEILHLETPSAVLGDRREGHGGGRHDGRARVHRHRRQRRARPPRRRGRPHPDHAGPPARGAARAGAGMSDPHLISITVNGVRHETVVEARRSLADVLRHDLGLTGTHIGCEHGICGTCTVLVEGKPARSCLMFGVQADDLHVETVEGLAENGELNALQQAFADAHGLQCGYCTPGFLMLATALAARQSPSDRRRDPRRDVRQPVPLHRLRGDPGGRARRRRRLNRGDPPWPPPHRPRSSTRRTSSGSTTCSATRT